MREQPKIPEERLRACLQEHYDLIPTTLEFLPRGHDYNAGVYRVVSEQGTPYLLKAELVQRFDQNLAEDGGHISAAYAAAAHLPKDLTMPTRKNL